jgi:hypothetical protein
MDKGVEPIGVPTGSQTDTRWFGPLLAPAMALIVSGAIIAIALKSTPIDDAYISFRYLDNWLDGKGLVFNAGERVEGYSNFLWIAVLAAPGVLGIGPVSAAPWLEVALAAGCLVLLLIGVRQALGRPSFWVHAAPLLLTVNGAFLFWIGKGMEVVFYSTLLLAFGVVILAMRERPRLRAAHGIALGLLAGAAALTRPEGAAAPGIVLAALFLADRDRRAAYAVAIAVLAAAIAGQFAFRLAYYGSLWPNTFYAKRLPLGIALRAGLNYVRAFAMLEDERWFHAGGWAGRIPVWIAGATALGFAARQWRRLWPIALLAAVLTAVAVYLGGDWMPAFRFLVPVVPLGCLILAVGLGEMADAPGAPRWRRLTAPGLLAVLAVAELLGLMRMVESHEFGRWRHHIANYGKMARWLGANARPGAVVALSDIGIISYLNPEMNFIDVLGLTDAHIAAQPGLHYLKTDLDYVLKHRPDYVLAMVRIKPDPARPKGFTAFPKTPFDGLFLEHVGQAKDYARAAKAIPGWKEGTEGQEAIRFDVYARKPSGS